MVVETKEWYCEDCFATFNKPQQRYRKPRCCPYCHSIEINRRVIR